MYYGNKRTTQEVLEWLQGKTCSFMHSSGSKHLIITGGGFNKAFRTFLSAGSLNDHRKEQEKNGAF